MAEVRTAAVLDIGSNTIRLLVASVHDGKLERLLDRSEFVRLGQDVDKTGRLRPDREDAAVDAIRQLSGVARAHDADPVLGIATSAVRDAENGKEFTERAEQEARVETHIISGDREAELTFIGATYDLDLGKGAIVVDLGGGSAELIAADASGIRWATSLKLGSGRLTERFIKNDPPGPDETKAVAEYVHSVLDGLERATVERAVFTGGTATHVAWLAGRDGQVEEIDLETLRRVAATLGSKPAAEIADEYGVKLERAQVLPAGVAALEAIAGYYGVKTVTITRHGIREGVLIDYFRK